MVRNAAASLKPVVAVGIVETASDGPVDLTRNGELVGGVVSVPDLEFLARAKELRDRLGASH